jgi:Domain of unknown function (DUF4258)
VRFSRHAKNRMRLYRVSRAEVAMIVAAGKIGRFDADGRPVFVGESRDGRVIEIVMALDAAKYVITVFGETDR